MNETFLDSLPRKLTAMGAEDGVFSIRVRGPSGEWVTLPYTFYFGSAYVLRLGDHYADRTMSREEAQLEARRTIQRFKVANPDREYGVYEDAR